jgi:hypothetical protein
MKNEEEREHRSSVIDTNPDREGKKEEEKELVASPYLLSFFFFLLVKISAK